ncbi:MAG: hypothetical protein HY700_16830 [Gemmatimonadetes bacterium]|nr:hypothetical protein [Gemmatimonadota bacterium]
MQELKNDEMIAKLRDSARTIAYYATLCGRGDEIGTAIGLSPWYALCRGVAAPEFLTEIVSAPVDEGLSAGRAELQRLAAEKEALAEGNRKLAKSVVEQELAVTNERERLSTAAHGYQRAEARLAEEHAAWERKARKKEQQLQHRAAELDRRDAALKPFEDLEAGRARLASDREAFDGKLVAAQQRQEEEMRVRREALEREWATRNSELTVTTVAQGKREQEMKARHGKEAAELQGREQAVRKSGRRWLSLQVAAFIVLVGAAFLPVRDRLVAPYVDARAEFWRERGELTSWRDKLASKEAELNRRENVVQARVGQVEQVASGLDAKRAEIREAERALGAREQKLQRAEQQFGSWEATLIQWERDLSAGRQQLATRRSELERRDAAVAATEASLQQESAELSQLSAQLENRENQVRELAEAATRLQDLQRQSGTVDVTLVNPMAGDVDLEVAIGGTRVRTDPRSGLATVALPPGRYVYSLMARGGRAGRAYHGVGRGVLMVGWGGGRFALAGSNPNLRLVASGRR